MIFELIFWYLAISFFTTMFGIGWESMKLEKEGKREKFTAGMIFTGVIFCWMLFPIIIGEVLYSFLRGKKK